MRSSALLLLALLAAAACLAHASAESAPPRRSLATGGLSTTGPGSDLDWCLESLLTLGLWCKHDLLESFLAGRPAPRACCRAADEAFHHCGPFTRAFLGSLLPLGPLAHCAHPAIIGTPALETGAGVSGGARSPPPPRVTSGTPKQPPRSSVRIPPPEAPSGTPQGSPETTNRAPALSGGARDGSPPKPKVIASGSAGGRARPAPDAYAAVPPPQKGVRTASPSAKSPAVE